MKRNLQSLALLTPLAASILGSPPAAAQNAVPLVLQGDTLPGIGNVVLLLRVWVNSNGDWLAEVDTDAPNGTDNVLLLNGTPILREGDPVGAPGGTAWVIGDVDLDEHGRVLVNHALLGAPGGSAADQGVWLDGQLVVLESDLCGAPQVGAGTTYSAFEGVDLTQGEYALLRGRMMDPSVPGSTETFMAKVRVDSAGNLLEEDVLALESWVPPGLASPIQNVRMRDGEAAIGACGDVIWGADLTGDIATDGVVYFNDTLVAREGSATGYGGVWGDLDDYEVDVNDGGDWVLSDRRSDDTRLILTNGDLLVEEGDSLPDIAPFVIEALGGSHVEIDDAGRVLWQAEWSDPLPQDDGLFLDDRLLVQRGVTQSNGTTLQAIGNGQQSFSVSPNGRWVAFQGVLEGGTDGFFLIDLEVGVPYCTSSLNSTGLRGRIHASGTTSIADNDLTLIASDLPPNQTGLIYFGAGQVQAPFGNGTRCVGGSQLYRLPTQTATKSGILAHRLDYDAAPVDGVIVAGTTWNFQAWYRDPAAGGFFFDLTDAVTVTFQP